MPGTYQPQRPSPTGGAGPSTFDTRLRGYYEVRVVREGYRAEKRSVVVRPGEETRVLVELRK